MNWSQHRPIDISKIRDSALFLIMPNSEQKVALPHGRNKGLSRNKAEKRTCEALNMHGIV
ncbi:hypothetical protein CQP30_11890 [Yersinia pestis]|nr:hypothetical protein EGX42_12855 [Yersinia pestis]OSZ89435.1 hypothetical protein A7725_09590 [Yersinia pestis subsp. microtus bv. Caucasica]OUY12629.1 hypothetical protein BFI40_18145 [Yersinia pestis subsp. microtus bv. Altaica]OVY74033.1 hypothetical protein BFI50_17205 [Yersinia pestis subsp. microtus bv. Xilingolensis]OVY84934.1 hypothetical protein BFI52_10830 [Yersinia pestis subsp. microtus]PSH18487.1 hypothetical protein B7R74_14960 [Yersinia pseudotuberculosis]QFR86441.1 hypothet